MALLDGIDTLASTGQASRKAVCELPRNDGTLVVPDAAYDSAVRRGDVYKRCYETALSMLAQCETKFFLFGGYEIRKRDGAWLLMRSGKQIKAFENAVNAVITAKDLTAIANASDEQLVAIVEADPT